MIYGIPKTPPTNLDAREEGVEHSLTREQWMVGGKFFGDGSHLTHGPNLQHAKFGFLPIELHLQDGVRD